MSSEELLQKDILSKGIKFGDYEYYNIGNTTLNQLSKSKIIPSRDYGKYKLRKPDALLVDRQNENNPEVITVIEFKKKGGLIKENMKLKAVQQCNDVAQELNANIGIVTDGENYIWFNPKQSNKNNNYKDKTKTRSYTIITDSNGNPIQSEFNIDIHKNNSSIDIMEDKAKDTYNILSEILLSISKSNSKLISLNYIDPLPLAKTVWQDIWIATGQTPERCLYNVMEIFIFKFLSDLEILKNPENYDFLLDLYSKRDNKYVLDYYAKNCRNKIYSLFPKSKTDNTTIINGTIFVNEKGDANLSQSVLFENTIRKFYDFEKQYGKFINIDKNFKTKLYETFLKQTEGFKGLGQYFTPRKVVKAIVQMSGISEMSNNIRFCDPFCGVGGFVLEPLNLYDNIKSSFIPQNKTIIPNIIMEGYDKGSERDEERTIILAKANMLIYLSDIISKNPNLTKEFSKLFNNVFHLLKTNLGTLGFLPDDDHKYDLILSNPPYVTKGKKTIINEIKNNAQLDSFFTINSTGIEGLAIEWIIKNLKPGGIAFIIIPDGVLNRLADKKIREFIIRECFLYGIVSLPSKTFFATSKKTYILSIKKKHPNKTVQKFPVFTYLVQNIGETLDINRFNIPQNDLEKVVELYNQYKGSPKSFKSKDSKCKLQPFSKFKPEESWIIDRWWPINEKINLGIESKKKHISSNNLYNKVDELIKDLTQKNKIIKSDLKKNKYKFINKLIGDIFDLSITTNNSKFTKAFVNNHKGKIPVYSASKTPDFIGYGKIKDNLPKIKYFENCLTWNIDGFIGKSFYREGRFSLSEKVIPLILKKEYKNLCYYEYLKYVIEKEVKKMDFNYSNKSGKNRIKSLTIKLPVKSINGRRIIDIDKQKELAKKYRKIEEVLFFIQTINKDFKDINVDI